MGIRKSEMSLMESKYTNLLKKPHTKIGDDSISMSKTIPEDLDEAIEFDIDKQIDIYEVNYQDVIDSWINPEKKKKGQKQALEHEDLIKRQYSASKIFNQASSDSLDVENNMIMKIKPQHQMYKDQLLSSSIDQRSKGNNTIDSKLGRGSISLSMTANEDPYAHLKARYVFAEKA